MGLDLFIPELHFIPFCLCLFLSSAFLQSFRDRSERKKRRKSGTTCMFRRDREEPQSSSSVFVCKSFMWRVVFSPRTSLSLPLYLLLSPFPSRVSSRPSLVFFFAMYTRRLHFSGLRSRPPRREATKKRTGEGNETSWILMTLGNTTLAGGRPNQLWNELGRAGTTSGEHAPSPRVFRSPHAKE